MFDVSDYPSVQAALDAVQAAGGGTLWVTGVHTFSDQLVIKGSTTTDGHRDSENVVTIRGTNRHSSVLRFTGTANPAIISDGKGTRSKAVDIRDITLEGNPASPGVGLDLQIRPGDADSCTAGSRFQNVTFLRWPSVALKFNKTYDIVLDDVYFRECGIAWDIGGPASDGTDFVNLIRMNHVRFMHFGKGGPSRAPASLTLTSIPGPGKFAAWNWAYRICYVNSDFGETAVTPETKIKTTAIGSIQLTFPAAPNSRCTAIRVYGRGEGSAHFIIDLPPTATSWIDDGSIIADKTRMPSVEYPFGCRIRNGNSIYLTDIEYNSNAEQMLFERTNNMCLRDAYFETPPLSGSPWLYFKQVGETVIDNVRFPQTRDWPHPLFLFAGRRDGDQHVGVDMMHVRANNLSAPPIQLGNIASGTNAISAFPMRFYLNQFLVWTGKKIDFVNASPGKYVYVDDENITTVYNGKGEISGSVV